MAMGPDDNGNFLSPIPGDPRSMEVNGEIVPIADMSGGNYPPNYN